jgi:hypothetical protein
MALANVYELIQTKVESLGFTPWEDAFQIDNIPSTIQDKSFHVEIGSIGGEPADHTTHRFTFPMLIRVIRRGFRYPSEAKSQAMVDADSILAGLLAPSFRLLVGEDVKDLVPAGVELREFSGSNDNVLVLEIRIEALIISKF